MIYDLPPLPELYGRIGFHDVYTADQMRAYAQAALDALAAPSVPSVPVAWLELRTLSSGGYASPIKEWHATQNPSTSNAPRKPLYAAPQPAPAGEPVAWIYQNANTEREYLVWQKGTGGRNWRPLYIAPGAL